MTQNLFKTFTFVKSSVLRTIHLNPTVRCFGIFKTPAKELRYGSLNIRTNKLHGEKTISTSSLRTEAFTFQQNTNVANNVLLWKHNGEKYFKRLAIFSVGQFIVLALCSYNVFAYIPSMKDDESYWTYIKRAFLPLFLFIFPVLTGALGIMMIWLYSSRSLRTIILHKGGKKVTLTTFHPLSASRTKVVPVDDIAIRKSRSEINIYMPLKIKSTRLYHLMDKDGEFVNPMLFDHTIGMSQGNEENILDVEKGKKK